MNNIFIKSMAIVFSMGIMITSSSSVFANTIDDKDSSTQESEVYKKTVIIGGKENMNKSTKGSFSASTNDRGIILGNMSIAEYINNFDTRSARMGHDGYTKAWSPSGTQTASYDGFPVTVSITPSYNGVTLGAIGTSFTLGKREDKVTSFNTENTYTTEFSTNNGTKYPNTQNLNAVIAYDINGSTTWSWSYPFSYKYWY